MKIHHHEMRAVVSAMALCALMTVAPAKAAENDELELAGTVEINSIQVAFMLSGKAGGGVLEFQGKEYTFGIGGLGIGGIGVVKMNAVGAVYNMTDVAQFSGTYVNVRTGATLGQGKGSMRLGNKNGVTIDLKFSSKGAGLSLGVDGMVLTLNQ